MARDFDGSTQFLNSDSGSILTAAPLTMAAWFKTDVTSGARSIFTIGGVALSSFDQAFTLIQVNTAFWALCSGGTTEDKAISSTSLSSGTWFHGCGVFASTTSRSAFINGAGKITNTTSVTPDAGDMDSNRIGQRSLSGANQKFNGNIAEVSVWNAALTDAEVATLATGVSALAVRPASLVGYWPLVGRYSPEINLMGGYEMSLTAAPPVAAHPRVLRPAGLWTGFTAAAGGGGGGGTIPVIYHHLRQQGIG